LGHCLQARQRESVSARLVNPHRRFTCFNAPQNGGPSTDDDRKQEAYDSVRGWPFGAAEAIEATPASGISRGRLGDRWAGHAGGRLQFFQSLSAVTSPMQFFKNPSAVTCADAAHASGIPCGGVGDQSIRWH